VIPLLVAATLTGLPPSQAVLAAYDMACNRGQLRLDPAEAQVISPDTSAQPDFFKRFGAIKSVTTIVLTYPKDTEIKIATYSPKRSQQMASVCVVISKTISREDAARGFLSGSEGGKPWQDLNPAWSHMPLEIDRPKDGYRKRLYFDYNGWVILETGLYKEPH
jgi:hypothetical protein